MAGDRYQKALAFILSRQHFGIKLGLDNILRLDDWLGNPHRHYPIVHVAGTNGKGSTSSYIASILHQSGYRVGLFTSPHLADFRERIRIDGFKISHRAVADFVEDNKRQMIAAQATFFEVTTALAMWHFKREKVDWAVLETGLGGRLDATNIVVPKIAVITNIGLEHTNILGKTIARIAGEKGGIIKPGVPVVTGIPNDDNPAARRIRAICAKVGAPVFFLRPADYRCWYREPDYYMAVHKGRFAGLKTRLPLAGGHQAANANLAVKAVELLVGQGYHISPAAVKKGLQNCYWPARFMTVRARPTIIIDVSHNPAGFAALAETLAQRFPGRRFDFLIGMVELKRGEECLKIIAGLARAITVTPLRDERSEDPYVLISRLDPGTVPLRIFPDAGTAYQNLVENSAPSDILIITGSHYLIGELAPYLRRSGF